MIRVGQTEEVDRHKRVAPLLGRREPIVGESLMSVLARACSASGFRNISGVLSSIGISSPSPFVPFTQATRAADLAALLRVREDQIVARMHPGGREIVDWWGEPLRRVFLEARSRRYSPASLRLSAHHRAAWMIRPLPFCPESYELLSSECPDCRRTLGWTHTRGLDRCEHCGSWLTDTAPGTVGRASRADASRVAALVSFDPVERERAIRSLPDPFSRWRASDVFEAVVELGVASHRLDVPSNRQGALILGDGRYEEITTPILLAGLGMLDRWPGSLTMLVDRIGASANLTGSTGLADCLGPLGKFLQHHRVGSPLTDAIAAEAATAFRAARIPVKSTALARFAPPDDDGLISEKEVLEQFDIYQRHLRRLDKASDTLVLKRASVSKLYDRARLERAVAAFRAAKTSAEAARILGVPGFALPVFGSRGLIDLEDDRDAILLSDADCLVTNESLARLLRQAEGLRHSSGSPLKPLSHVLRRIFSPEAWAVALEVALSGEASIAAQPASNLADQLMVAPGAICAALGQSEWSFPGDIGVSCITAGKLIGQSDVLMSKAVTEGAIAASVGNHRHTIQLRDLHEFSSEYAFTNEIAALLGCSAQSAGKHLRAAGLHPARMVYRMVLWDRRGAEEALALSALPQHQITQRAA
jgi:hypothetical protein